MTYSLYIQAKDASALKLCVCVAASADNVDISVVPHGSDVSKKVDVPLLSQGLPALVTEDGAVIQECHAAAKLLGTPDQLILDRRQHAGLARYRALILRAVQSNDVHNCVYNNGSGCSS